MTEAEWLSSTEVTSMLDYLSVWQNKRGRTFSHRRLRLFCCAYVRLNWSYFVHDYSREALIIAEQLADEMVNAAEVEQASRRAELVVAAIQKKKPYGSHLSAARGASWLISKQCGGFSWNWWNWFPIRYSDRDAEQPSILLRDLVGNIFSPQLFDPDWRIGDVTAIARAAYDQRSLPIGHLDPLRLAILADALEEVGCTNKDVLQHLRSTGPHVRGCFAVDLCLGLS